MGPEEGSFVDEDDPPRTPPGSTEDDEAPPSEETGRGREHWRLVKIRSNTLLISSGELAMDLLEMSYVHHLQWEERLNVTVKIHVTCVMNMRTSSRTNACEVSSTKIIKGSDEANSFPLSPRRKVIT